MAFALPKFVMRALMETSLLSSSVMRWKFPSRCLDETSLKGELNLLMACGRSSPVDINQKGAAEEAYVPKGRPT